MNKTLVMSLVIVAWTDFHTTAQDTLSNEKALNIPTARYGISIGNSHEFTGLRINLSDKDVKVVNGVNITLWMPRNNRNSIFNGANIGLIPNGGTMRPISIGLIAIGTTHNLSGLSIGGLAVGAGDHINGLSLSGLYTEGQRMINGLACSGIFIASNGTINGLAVSGLFLASEENINGVATCPVVIWNESAFSGIALTMGYFFSENLNGLTVAGYSNTGKTNGVSVALFNRTKELHGIQFGLLNYAGNNSKVLKILPVMNLHF